MCVLRCSWNTASCQATREKFILYVEAIHREDVTEGGMFIEEPYGLLAYVCSEMFMEYRFMP
jgi:hypothetical protein